MGFLPGDHVNGTTSNGGTKAGGTPTSNIQITSNVISTAYYPRGGQWGPVAYYHPGSGNVWSGNTWDGNGQTIPSP